MDHIVYEERQTFAGWVYFPIAIAVVIILALAYEGARSRDLIPAGITLLAVCGVLWIFARFRVVVTADEFRFGFRVFAKQFSLMEIEVGDIRDITFWQGVGIHYVRGTAVWNAKLGRGVLIHYGKRRYLVGSDQPERLQSVLRERKAELAR